MNLEREKEILNVGLSKVTLDPNSRFICSANELQLLEWNDFKEEYITSYFKKGRIYIRYTKWTKSTKYKNAYKIENEWVVNFLPEWKTYIKHDYFCKFHKSVVEFMAYMGEPISLKDFEELEEIWKEKFILKGDE